MFTLPFLTLNHFTLNHFTLNRAWTLVRLTRQVFDHPELLECTNVK
ncbi:hypothetical protein ALO36_102810 [Pseudomonas syringae pv. tomato]|nr:hypothetical protein ALO84_101543 [Pseudomonas syringae pv. maculicola]KPY94783.1 hypothetical protein ALO36_102810 [Pseudomonas syringae pv. tomato]RMO81386.1 hypothetical protein ALQ34_102514 [Pseudomonas syringae pv. maculicola]